MNHFFLPGAKGEARERGKKSYPCQEGEKMINLLELDLTEFISFKFATILHHVMYSKLTIFVGI